MATAKKAAPKLAAIEPGKCRRIIDGKRHMAPVPADHPNWTWCRECVTEHAASRRAASPSTKPKAKPAAKPARAKVAPNSGGQVRSKRPPTQMHAGPVARIPSAPEGYAPVVQLVANS